jgi:hypothetical protein
MFRRTLFLTLSLTIFFTSCAQFGVKRQPSSASEFADMVRDGGYFKVNAGGDPEKVKDVPIHPDLVVPAAAYSDEVLKQIQERVDAVASQARRDIEPATIKIPDYKFAYNALQKNIEAALANYFVQLEGINNDIKVFFSQVEALRILAEDDALFKTLLDRHLLSETPKVNESIRSKYHQALRQLYFLDASGVATNNLLIAERSKVLMFKGKKENIAKEKSGALDARTTLFRHCRTAACVLTLAGNIKSWFTFVEKLNQDIDFVNFNKERYTKLGQGTTVPMIAIAVADFADRLTKGIEDNKQYNIASYMGAIAKVPAGAVIGITAAPLYVFEKAGLFAKKLATSTYIQLSLNVKGIDMYAASDINSRVNFYADKVQATLPTVVFEETKNASMVNELTISTGQEVAKLDSAITKFFPVNALKKSDQKPVMLTAGVACKAQTAQGALVICSKPFMIKDGQEVYFSQNSFSKSKAEDICSSLGLLGSITEQMPYDFPQATFVNQVAENVYCIKVPGDTKPQPISDTGSFRDDGTKVVLQPRVKVYDKDLSFFADGSVDTNQICKMMGYESAADLSAWVVSRQEYNRYSNPRYYYTSGDPKSDFLIKVTSVSFTAIKNSALPIYSTIVCK